ncbi:helix-turn-helix transcriptional regulator [Rhodococcus maanshanensis]|uniref:helix-turn-helix domain-containing protein n=1 Tax=Rhodococcus maanshanensis TaxID=183556 RepID=UPI0022B48E8E|nr:helix-turn-helix transcriptional regulator [Rhodococcus maanshanensis]MCZ4557868.1 helix-turn-helix transcriptional regulator [Rhodococcus maanshanensis]
MAEHGFFKTTELVPLLAERGVALSREQVYRVVTSTPSRLNLEVLAALCDILGCTPNVLIRFNQVASTRVEATAGSTQGVGPYRRSPRE